jgi:hypothetical protein
MKAHIEQSALSKPYRHNDTYYAPFIHTNKTTYYAKTLVTHHYSAVNCRHLIELIFFTAY